MEKFIKPIVENSVKPNEIGKLEEFGSSELKNGKIIEQDLDLVKSGSLESLNSLNQEKNLDLNKLSFPTISESDKTRIKEDTGWSNEIIEKIKNKKQYEIYKNANLSEEMINNRKCLIKDINLDYVDEKTGEKIELHHMDQEFNAPFAELTEHSEHGGKNHKILHDNSVESWRRNPELKKEYNNIQRPEHWRSRLAMLES